MDLPFRIEKKESFRVIGYMIQTTNKKGEGRKAVPSHWARFKAEGLEKATAGIDGTGTAGVVWH